VSDQPDSTAEGRPPPSLAARLRGARLAAGLTQRAAADALGVSRPLLVAIEKGARAVRPEELTVLARLYGRSVHELVRPTPPLEAFGAQFRSALAAAADAGELQGSVEELERLGDDYLELARLAGATLPRRYPPATEITGLDPQQAAEDLSSNERNRLGLGDGPILSLRELLDEEVGVRIFAPQLPSHIAGAFVYAEPLGGTIAVNANHPCERQRWTLAHEYGHFLSARARPEVTVLRRRERVPAAERFADAFAAYFLMPRAGLHRRFHSLSRDRAGEVTAADLLQLAHSYRVSLQAMILRLEDLRLLPPGSFDQLRDLGFRPSEAARLLGPRPAPDQTLLPPRYRYLAAELYVRAEITEGQLARFLRLDRLNARRVVEELTGSEDVGPDGDVIPLRLAEGAR
jgi:Zn-dependent peptidase ImmA (M78 family)/transcriptional regulator with XRE-family HTH domain